MADNNNRFEDNFEDDFLSDLFGNKEENSSGQEFEDISSGKIEPSDEYEDINSNIGSQMTGFEDVLSDSQVAASGFEDISSNSEDITSFGKDRDLSSKNNNSIDLNSFSTKQENNKKAKEKRKKTKAKTMKRRIIKIVLSSFLLGVIVLSLVIGAFVLYAFTMIDGKMTQDLNQLKLNFTTTIYVKDSKTGEFVEYQRLHGEYNRIWVEYDAKAAKNKSKDYKGIPQQLVNAFVAIEDKRFYSHYGVDWKRTTAAFANMFLHFYSSDQGGSTITQQLVKNLTSDDEKNAGRKLREIMRARYLESHYSKDTIMECYLNVIALGHGMSGVGVASNYYFNKDVCDLTLAECATIAAITKSPSYYAPDSHPNHNKDRREAVLKEMLSQGYISKKEYNAALKEDIKIIADDSNVKEKTVNSYAVDAIIEQVAKEISKKKNCDMKKAYEDFYNSGYKIYATIDPDIQATVDKVFADSDKYAITAADGKKLQGSITVMDYKGHVLALSGGIGEKKENLSFNRATDAARQPGSTMKPIAAYAPAIENNIINYSTILDDNPKPYPAYQNWKPNNWYGGPYGKKTVRQALQKSSNAIPVSIVDKLTPQYCYKFLTERLGITTLTEEDKNLLSPFGMGGTNGGITTMQSAAAYAVFGNGGTYYEPCLYYKVCDQYDNVVFENKEKGSYAISSDTATVMNKLLQNVVYGEDDYATGRGAKSYIPNMRIYAKTGTSNDSNDLWFVAGSPYYVASCWCGYDEKQAIPSVHSGIAHQMWGAIMSEVHKNLPVKEFEVSKDAKCCYFCKETGELATNKCPSTEIGWYRKNGLPKVCTTHEGTVLPEVKEAS